MPPPSWTIRPAHLLSCSPDPDPPKGYLSQTLKFSVPLLHTPTSTTKPSAPLSIHATLIHAPSTPHPAPFTLKSLRRPLLYLCGGPGDGNNPRRIPELNRLALSQGYQLLYVDYRGTGRSLPFLSGSHLSSLFPSAAERAEYLSLFRQDNIVRDLEAIRLCLSEASGRGIKWTLLGQSFGGWIALTYLSFLPGALAGVFLTAGLAPVGRTPGEVYGRLFERVVERNERYYGMFPGDAEHVRRVVAHLRECEYDYRVEGSRGRHRLTGQGFLTLGRCFGAGGKGMERVHALVEMMVGDVVALGGLREETVLEYAALQARGKKGLGFRLHERPLYGVLHEGIYCGGPGVVAGWAAERVGRGLGDEFGWLREGWEASRRGRLFFSGEMVFPFMLESAGSELTAFREAADLLAKKDDWPALYDEVQLARNTVPVRAIAYRDDMYVDFDLSMETGRKISNCVVLEGKKHWGHGAIKAAETSAEVLETLFGIRRVY